MDQAFGKKVMHTALVIIPPQENCTQIQTLRKVHDKQFNRWMPHINMAFPFFDLPDFEKAAEKLQEGLSSLGINIYSMNYRGLSGIPAEFQGVWDLRARQRLHYLFKARH